MMGTIGSRVARLEAHHMPKEQTLRLIRLVATDAEQAEAETVVREEGHSLRHGEVMVIRLCAPGLPAKENLR